MLHGNMSILAVRRGFLFSGGKERVGDLDDFARMGDKAAIGGVGFDYVASRESAKGRDGEDVLPLMEAGQAEECFASVRNANDWMDVSADVEMIR